MRSLPNIKPSKGTASKDKKTTEFTLGRTQRNILEKLLVICGRLESSDIGIIERKANELNVDFVREKRNSWIFIQQTIRERFDPGRHEGILLIGSNKELPGTQISYEGAFAYTDWFFQDVDGDDLPDTPVGRIFGPLETILYHLDPRIIDSNIAVIFDSQPGRSMRHVEGLTKLGFNVEILKEFSQKYANLLSVSEFILQFSDGVFSSRIHGTPEKWASHNSDILTSVQTEQIQFEGYPVVYSEACSTAQEGPLLKAFLNQGAAYIGATLDTLNNVEPFDEWQSCAYADGWKFGFLDLLDSRDTIGQVKIGVDREITANLGPGPAAEINAIRRGDTSVLRADEAVSTIEWVLFGNPMRRSTVGPNADYSPGRLMVDT
ncbi:MAG: hypothetical protein ACFFEF_05195 [Candidatus Thorarchaeota archaeon]